MKHHIKIITLDPESKTSLELLDSIRNQGLKATFFNAVDGRKNYPRLLNNESVDQEKCFQYRLSHLSSGEIGCYLSHYRCILEEYNNGTETLCILEDDIFIEPEFSTYVTLIFNLETNYELVKLTALKMKKRKVSLTLSNGFKITRPTKGTLGTQGYVINRLGMEKLLKKGMPIVKPIDKFYDHFWESDINTFSIEPYIIWEKETLSSIEKPKKKYKADFFKKITYKHLKITRSFKGLIYRIKNHASFYPNSKIDNFNWKTVRKLKK